MRQLMKSEKSRKKTSGFWKAFRKTGRKIAYFASLLPLLCAPLLSTGCNKVDKCFRYNDTTIKINRDTDGRVSKAAELNKALLHEDIMSGELIDFVNETHAVSSEGMPSDVRVTSVGNECNYKMARAYAVMAGGDIGTYFIEEDLPLTLTSVSVLFHEIGHLQGNYLEIMSHTNEFEQNLMGFVVFSNHEDSLKEMYKWAYILRYISMKGDLERISRIFDSDSFSYESISESESLKSYIFILNELQKTGGDFSALRTRVRELGIDGLESAMELSTRDFLERYSASYPGSYPGIDLAFAVRMANTREILRRFGREAAIKYLDSHSPFPYKHYLPYGVRVFVEGMEGMNCLNKTGPDYTFKSSNADSCSGDIGCFYVGANRSESISDDFCCFTASISEDDTVEFQKWKVSASGKAYYYEDLQYPLCVNGESWWDVFISFDEVSKERIGEGGFCR